MACTEGGIKAKLALAGGIYIYSIRELRCRRSFGYYSGFLKIGIHTACEATCPASIYIMQITISYVCLVASNRYIFHKSLSILL